MRVYILEDCEILRLSLQLVLNQEPDFEVIGACSSDNEQVCQSIIDSKADVVLIGLRLRKRGGLEIARELMSMSPSMSILAIGFSTDVANVTEMKRAGIKVFVPMTSSNEFIANQIRQARSNVQYCDFSGLTGSPRITY